MAQVLALQIKLQVFYLKDYLKETSTIVLLGMELREFNGK